MSVITLSSEQIAAYEEQQYDEPPRPLRHTSATRWHMILMAMLFMFEFILNICITYLLYTNNYKAACYTSISFIVLFYSIGLCLGFMAIRSQSHDSFLLCILFLLCFIILLPIFLPCIICIFCIKEAMQNYSKIQLMVNIIPLFSYICIQAIFGLIILSTQSLQLFYTFDEIGSNDNDNKKQYDLSWMISLSVFVCILFYIDVFALILFHGGHIMTKYFKSALFMSSTLNLEFMLIAMCVIIRFYVDDWENVDDVHKNVINWGIYNYFIFRFVSILFMDKQ